MYSNDHISIDNILIDVERKVENVGHLRSSLYEIFEIEDYKKLRGDLSQFLYDYESDVKTVIDALKHIQQINRQFYDSYAIMKNNEIDMLQRFNCFQKENEILKERLTDSMRQVEYLGGLKANQENYINDLLDKLKKKEKKEYGCQLTRNPFAQSSNLNSPKSYNYDYNNHNNQVPFYAQEIDKGIQLNPAHSDKKHVNNIINKNSNENEGNYKQSQGNNDKLPSLEQVEQLYEKNKMNEKIKQENQQKKIDLKYEEKFTDNKDNNEDMKSKGDEKKDIKESDKNNNEQTLMITTEKEKSNHVGRVQNIIIKAFKSKAVLSDLKSKFGNNFLDKITSPNLNENDLIEVESVLMNRSITTNEEPTEKNKETEESFQHQQQIKKPHNITQLQIPHQLLHHCSNESNLKKYFMYNLLQEKTIIKDKIKPKGINCFNQIMN